MDEFTKKIPQILKQLFEQQQIVFENQNIYMLKEQLNSFQSDTALIQRYNSTLYSDIKNCESENNNSQYFECRIQGYFNLTQEDLKEYLKKENIDINDYYENEFQIKDDARKWKEKEIIFKLNRLFVDVKKTKFGNIFLINNSESKIFLNHFIRNKYIDWSWSGLSSDENFDWTVETIELGVDNWDWEALISNKSINWSFELIDKYKDKLNWAYVSSLNLDWDINSISKFKEYIVFKGGYGSGLINANGKWNRSDAFARYSEKYKVIGNISANTFIKWDDSIIDEFIDLFDWSYLSSNESVNWTASRINKYENRIDFELLSRNMNVEWSSDLIDSYANKLNFDGLLKNPKVIWTIELVENNIKNIEPLLLAKYANIDSEIIIKFETLWDKKVTQTHGGRRNSDGIYSYYTQHTLWEYLCLNEHVVWNDLLIEKYIDKLSLKDLNDSRICISTKTINKYWDYMRNEMTDYWESYSGSEEETFEDIYFRDKIKNATISDIDIDCFKENEIKWWGVLNDFNYLNKSIKEVLKQFLTQTK